MMEKSLTLKQDIISPILQMTNPGHRELKILTQASK